jgi:CMP-N-acetylneuraminic acid synthetase
MDNMVKRLAVIPARGGSKRIKKKNIVDFHGKPLLYWTIRAAQRSNLFEKIVVSTDDNEIACVARQYGALVPFMRDKYADDHSPISLATIDVLDFYKEIDDSFDTVVQLMANCPLRNENDIVDSVQNFENKVVPAQISCFRYGWMNPWWAVTLNDDSQPTPIFTEMLSHRSQDLKSLYCPSGAIWVGKPDKVRDASTFYCADHIFYEIPWISAIDIDDAEDFCMASKLFALTRV